MRDRKDWKSETLKALKAQERKEPVNLVLPLAYLFQSAYKKCESERVRDCKVVEVQTSNKLPVKDLSSTQISQNFGVPWQTRQIHAADVLDAIGSSQPNLQ